MSTKSLLKYPARYHQLRDKPMSTKNLHRYLSLSTKMETSIRSGLDNIVRDTLMQDAPDHGNSLIQSILDTTRAAATICGISLPIMRAATKSSQPGSFKTTVSHHPIDDLLCFSIQKAQREGRAKEVSGILVDPLLASLLGSQLQFIRILSQKIAVATSTGASPLLFPQIPETAPCLDTPVPTATPVASHPSSPSLPSLPIMVTVKQVQAQIRKGSHATLPSLSVTPTKAKPTSTAAPTKVKPTSTVALQFHTPAPFKVDEFQILEQGEVPRHIGDAPQHHISLEAKTVRDILTQWRFGVDGIPPLQELNSNFGTKWRYKSERNLYQTRRCIVREFIRLVKEDHLAEEDSLERLQQQLGQQSFNDLATTIIKHKKRKGVRRSSRNKGDFKPSDSDYTDGSDNDDDDDSDKGYAPSLSAKIESSSSAINKQPIAVNIESKWAMDEVLACGKRTNSTASIFHLRFAKPKPIYLFSKTNKDTSTNESATESGVTAIYTAAKRDSTPAVIPVPYKKRRQLI
ncbi:hypothetical protein BG011_005739 [Mortierella polycephala]|uniref:Transcription activator GCR1-like domain-containing protein n=1 Tax=Mortierella polycephala TaxID=41804 RepID=A0A9P6QFT4_9FUNG|nr:hypothetical protein BG011_005739 [Mortierella polycephala]